MTPTFWEKSMLVKPDDREVVCHASAEGEKEKQYYYTFVVSIDPKFTPFF